MPTSTSKQMYQMRMHANAKSTRASVQMPAKEMGDITIIYLTTNKLPTRWVTFQTKALLDAAKDIPIISVSRIPMSLGINIVDTGTPGYWNMYMQLLAAARIATTPFIAPAEDDVLYTPEHFREYRPQPDNVAFDRSRWSLFAWDPIYCLRQRVSNCAMIASREYLIECLSERQRRWPNSGPPTRLIGEVGRPKVDRRLGVTVRKPAEEWWCRNAIVHLNHAAGNDIGRYDVNGKRMIKPHGQLKALQIPYWGNAVDIAGMYNSTYMKG